MSGSLEPPEAYRPKKLIVCCDGTWKNSTSGTLSDTIISWLWTGVKPVPTNVTKISRAVEPIDSNGKAQIVYYQAGVGSEGNLIQRVLGGALGTGFADNIREAYGFIASNYVEGDEIYLVGFSRGAFTARSVGGMIGDFGLLTRSGLENIDAIFEDWEHAGYRGYRTLLSKAIPAFALKTAVADPKAYVSAYRDELKRLELTHDKIIPIKAIGVWETVGSLGIPVNPFFQRLGFPILLRAYRFYNTALGTNVENAFQALALDEKRSSYRPTIWQQPSDVNANLKQTWFPGAHSNVGGGLADMGLSTITLAWMMSNLAPFIKFDPDYIRRQYQINQAALNHEDVPDTGFKWAASKLQDTASGIKVIFGVFGFGARTPGRYHVLNKKTLDIRENEPLENTNEHVHVSVRSRMKTGGLDQAGEVKEYDPKAMSKYELDGAGAEPGKAQWRYEGKEKQFKGLVLPEDELGVFEKEIFQNYVTDAE